MKPMPSEVRQVFQQLLRHQAVSSAELQAAIGAVMDGRCDEITIAALLTALAMKEVTEDELVGAATAMRERAAVIGSRRPGLMDTCGTGGDHLGTFNISTAAALVLGAAGVPVAKHGNRSVSSTSGSADVLEALGVDITLSPEQAGACLDDIGLCFCFARSCHSAMRHVAPVRQQLGVRTIFNLLGPLTNPARAEYQLLGAARDADAARLAGAVRRLGSRRALVVCGAGELDEVALWGETRVWDVRGDQLTEAVWTAEDFGLPSCSSEQLRVSSPQESAAVIRSVLAGAAGPARNIVLANAAAAIWCCGASPSLRAGVDKAALAIDDGRAAALLNRLAEWTQSAAHQGQS